MISAPPIEMVPAVGRSKPAIIRSVVVLPQPDGPRNDTNSPFSALRLKSWTAYVVPNCFWIPVRVRKVMRSLLHQWAPAIWIFSRDCRPIRASRPMAIHVSPKLINETAAGSYALLPHRSEM